MEKEQILAVIQEAYRTRPNMSELQKPTEDTRIWIGQTNAILAKVSASIRSDAESLKGKGQSPDEGIYAIENRMSLECYENIEQELINQITNLELEVGPIATLVGEGERFIYHDALRKIIETATSELFIVDSYISADFVSDYLAHIAPSIKIRVLTGNKNPKDLQKALTSAKILKQQNNNSSLEIRTSNNVHDRYVFIDNRTCHMTGASIKDGGKKAAMVVKITDAYDATHATYEALWSTGTDQSLIGV